MPQFSLFIRVCTSRETACVRARTCVSLQALRSTAGGPSRLLLLACAGKCPGRAPRGLALAARTWAVARVPCRASRVPRERALIPSPSFIGYLPRSVAIEETPLKLKP